jgi:hypothetical protein
MLLRPLSAPQVLIEEHNLLLVGVEGTSARELILAQPQSLTELLA